MARNKPKITAQERGFNKTKSGRKEMKANDIFINRYAKDLKKIGITGGVTQAAPKSVSGVKGPRVPVKNSFRGGGGLGGAFGIKNR